MIRETIWRKRTRSGRLTGRLRRDRNNFLFEIGWIYNELIQEKNIFMKPQCRKYFEYALCISEMFYIERNASIIRKYLS